MDRMLGFWRRFREVAMLVGPLRALALAPGWLVRRQFLVFSRDLCDPLPDLPLPAGLVFRPLAVEEIGQLEAVNPSMHPGEVERRLAEGQRCLVGWLESRPVFYSWWFSDGSIFLRYVGLRLQLQPGDIFSDDTFTAPAFRGQNMSPAGQHEYYRLAREMGYRRDLGMSVPWSGPAMRVAAKTGRDVVARIDRWQLGPWRRYVLHGAARVQDGTLTILPAGSELPGLELRRPS
jgi:hypothetical protein